MGLIVLGGVDGANSNLASVECYDPSTKEWFALSDMSVARFGCAAAWFDGLLYVVGGEASKGTTVECFYFVCVLQFEFRLFAFVPV